MTIDCAKSQQEPEDLTGISESDNPGANSPIATIMVRIDDEEYCLEAAVVQDLVEEVLLGRDVPLCKHMVKCLPQEEQMDLL